MRKVILVVAAALALFLVSSCEKPASEPSQPELSAIGKPLPVFGVNRKRTFTEGEEDQIPITVKMRIVGTSILDTKKDNDPFFLLLPEVRDHEAFILADKKYKMKGTTARPPAGEPTSAPKYDVLLLSDDELSIDPAPVEALRYTIAGASCPPRTTDLQSLRWAPSISDALGKPVKINAKFTKTNPDKAGLAARLRITEGDVYASPINYDLWQFKTDKNLTSGHLQMLTTVVVHEYSLPLGTTKLIINTRDFASTAAPALLATLEPDANNEIEFTIGSTVATERLPGSGTAMDEDAHYPHLYDVVLDTAGSSVSSTIRPFKVIGARCLPPTTTLVNCGPGRP